MTKLGFFGAMNRDVVVPQGASQVLPALGLDVVPLVESPVSDDNAQAGATALGALGGSTYLGGSAFNVARIVGLLNADAALDLAFFGIAGTVEHAVPHVDALHDWGVSSQSVHVASLPPATCLALVEPAGRTLLTALGANAGVAAWLRDNRATLAASVAECDIIHITSYLDPEAPGLIAEILQDARALNPGLVVSLDPGMAWIAPGGEGLSVLLRQTSILHLNTEEIAALGGEEQVAEIGKQLRPDWTIVSRTHAGATVYMASPSQPEAQSLPSRPPAPDFVAVDATGAGDTFCGGFLWAYARNPDKFLDAAELGFALARHKVTLHGPLTRSDIAQMLTRPGR